MNNLCNQTRKTLPSLICILIILICICFYLFLVSQVNIPSSNNQLKFNVAFLITIFFGGVGGVLQSFRELYEESKTVGCNFNFSFICSKIFYVLNDYLSGIGGAFALNLFLISINKIEYSNELKNVMVLIGTNMVGGFLGYKALSGVANRIEKEFKSFKKETRITEKEIRTEVKLTEALDEGTTALSTKKQSDMEYAIQQLLPFIEIYPTHRKLIILIGRLYRWRGLYKEAIGVLSEFIKNKSKLGQTDEAYAVALYNRACYNTQIFYKLTDEKQNFEAKTYRELVLDDLKTSIFIFPNHKIDAISDEDFRALWDDPDFKQITK
jgi:tetratricopeptide (TPR) repeat protein